MKANGGVVMINFYNPYVNCAPKKTASTTIQTIVDHIEHIKNLIGVEHVGIGGDYDGVDEVPIGWYAFMSDYPD